MPFLPINTPRNKIFFSFLKASQILTSDNLRKKETFTDCKLCDIINHILMSNQVLMQILYTYPVESLVVKASAEREREWELC